MIKIEHTEVVGFEHAIRGMRNPMNSWDKSDSHYCFEDCPHVLNNTEPAKVCNNCEIDFCIGVNDLNLMERLAKGGPVHAKYRRMMIVYVDITAPLYWWKEFDTYKVGTVSNSCSTMHKIHSKEFTLDDFSHEHLNKETRYLLEQVIDYLNISRDCYNSAVIGEGTECVKHYWWQMIQLLPSSYNQKRTIMLNYEVLQNIYKSRKHHKLDEWREFCKWIESLPYSEIIITTEEN